MLEMKGTDFPDGNVISYTAILVQENAFINGLGGFPSVEDTSGLGNFSDRICGPQSNGRTATVPRRHLPVRVPYDLTYRRKDRESNWKHPAGKVFSAEMFLYFEIPAEHKFELSSMEFLCLLFQLVASETFPRALIYIKWNVRANYLWDRAFVELCEAVRLPFFDLFPSERAFLISVTPILSQFSRIGQYPFETLRDSQEGQYRRTRNFQPLPLEIAVKVGRFHF